MAARVVSEARDIIAEAVFRGVITSLQDGGCLPGWQSSVADAILSALKGAGYVVVPQELWEDMLNDMVDVYNGGPVGLNVVRDP